MQEIWKDIPYYEGLYQASTWGRVKSLNYHRENREKILTPARDKDGYLLILLYKDGKRVSRRLHKIIAETFKPDKTNFLSLIHEDRDKVSLDSLVINHRDEDKTNNNIDNLEWCTVGYNNSYSKSKKVKQYDLQGNLINVWKSPAEVERVLKYFATNIGACCKGKYKQAYGYKWKYADTQ